MVLASCLTHWYQSGKYLFCPSCKFSADFLTWQSAVCWYWCLSVSMSELLLHTHVFISLKCETVIKMCSSSSFLCILGRFAASPHPGRRQDVRWRHCKTGKRICQESAQSRPVSCDQQTAEDLPHIAVQSQRGGAETARGDPDYMCCCRKPETYWRNKGQSLSGI